MGKQLLLVSEGYKSGLDRVDAFQICQITAAKKDTASFQIALNTFHKNCRVNLSTYPSLPIDISMPIYRIEVLSDAQVNLFPEQYLSDEHGNQYADILLNSPQAQYSGAQMPVIWADVMIPENARPQYNLTVNLYCSVGANNEVKLESESMTILVKNYVMPQPKDYTMYVDLWQHNANIARYYGVELWSDKHFQMLEPLIKTLSDVGQKSITILAGDCPWQGWGCHLLQNTPANLFEYAIAQTTKQKDGSYQFDFSAITKYVGLCEKYGISGDITLYGLCGIWKMPLFPSASPKDCPEKVLVRYLDLRDGCYKYMDNQADIVEYITALFAFLRSENLFNRTYVGADEPADTKAYADSVALLKEIAPDVRLKMAIDHSAVIHAFSDSLYCTASSFPCSCNENDFLHKIKQENPHQLLLWYVCNIPDKPNTVFKSTLFETRLMGALNYLFGFDGFLRWAYYCWTVDPTSDICYNKTSLPAGDLCFVYPSKSGGVHLSIRYKLLKKGIEDFELINALKNKKGSALAGKALNYLFNNLDVKTFMKTDRLTADGIYNGEYSSYQSMRDYLLAQLEN